MLPKSTVSIAYEELPTGNTTLHPPIGLNPTSNMTARSCCRIYAGIGSSLANPSEGSGRWLRGCTRHAHPLAS